MGLSGAMGGWLKVVAVILVPLLLLPLPLLLNSTEDGKLNLSPFHRTLLHPPPPGDFDIHFIKSPMF